MNASLLNVLHDAADDNIAFLVAQCIHIQLICPVKVLVHKHRTLWVHLYCCVDVSLDVGITAMTTGML